MTAAALTGVSLSLGARTILAGVDVAIAEGEFVGLLGPNGAGKTTFLRALLGLVRPSAGTINVLGEPARRGNRRVGYMPQHRAGVPGAALTGWDYVASAAGGWRWGLPALNAAEREEVAWALEAVGATALARRPLANLSGGERQRLLISQALMGRPKLLLLDEPLISLDPAHQMGVVDLVRRLQRDFGMAVVFSAHDLNPLLNAVDRVLYLGQGQAVIGPVDDIVTGPVLSRLYGSPIEVMRVGGRIFVLSGSIEVEGDAHRHEGHDGHAHGHDHGEGSGADRRRA